MNIERTVTAAQERLLDAALAQVLAAPAQRAERGTPTWLAAALLLLGVAVTGSTMWLGRFPAKGNAVDRFQEQDETPLPMRVDAEGREALEALPADTQHLLASVLLPADLTALTRFSHLRRLVLLPLDVHVGPVSTGRKLPVWSKPPATLLAPIAALPKLESLQVGSEIAISPALLAPLARSPRLRELELHGDVPIDDAFVAALMALPHLRSLLFDLAPGTAATIARLRTLPITALRLSRPVGWDAVAWQELCRFESLEQLSLGNLGRSFQWRGTDHQFWMPSPDDLKSLGKLPKLRRLDMQACALTADHLKQLPEGLTDLQLQGHELTPDALAVLRRFGALRTLVIDTRRYARSLVSEAPELRAACGDAIASVLGTLRLGRLVYRGDVTPALLQAIVGQPDLADIELPVDLNQPEGALQDLARAPKLRRLALIDSRIPTSITPELLAPLRTSRSLRLLELHIGEERGVPGLDEAAVRRAVGDGADVRLHRRDYIIKR